MSSPYISSFIDVLRALDHEVSVVLPTTQRSWIGKAHLLPPSVYPLPGQAHPDANESVSDVCTPSYYDPTDGETHAYPLRDKEYWATVPGTPATCTQLGLFHFKELFPHKPPQPIDLVLSGPNHGRNTTAAFALSSGTLGGALEGAVSGVRAIALSFAFFTKQESVELVREASVHGMQIVEKLCQNWTLPMDSSRGALQNTRQTDEAMLTPDVYTINVPLVEGVSKKPVRWTWMLDNKWPTGSLYKAVNNPNGSDADAINNQTEAPPSFKWSPSFTSIWQIVDESPAGNDGKVIREGRTSVTPLKANFEGLYGKAHFSGEFKL